MRPLTSPIEKARTDLVGAALRWHVARRYAARAPGDADLAAAVAAVEAKLDAASAALRAAIVADAKARARSRCCVSADSPIA